MLRNLARSWIRPALCSSHASGRGFSTGLKRWNQNYHENLILKQRDSTRLALNRFEPLASRAFSTNEESSQKTSDEASNAAGTKTNGIEQQDVGDDHNGTRQSGQKLGENEDETAKEHSKDELELAKVKILELENEVAGMKDHMLRALAEAENTRARSLKEIETARTYAIQKFAKQLLDVADNLHRAIHSIPEEERKNNSPENHHLFALCEGVEMTSKQLEKVFNENGIVEFGEAGDAFDPHIHEAMFQIPDENKQPNTIAQVVKTGYKYKDRVLRPAQVGTVAANS